MVARELCLEFLWVGVKRMDEAQIEIIVSAVNRMANSVVALHDIIMRLVKAQERIAYCAEEQVAIQKELKVAQLEFWNESRLNATASLGGIMEMISHSGAIVEDIVGHSISEFEPPEGNDG